MSSNIADWTSNLPHHPKNLKTLSGALLSLVLHPFQKKVNLEMYSIPRQIGR